MRKLLSLLFLILSVVIVLSGCGNSAQNKSNGATNNSKQEQAKSEKASSVQEDKNPFSEKPTSIREIKAEPKNYIGKNVVLGPLKVLGNDVSNGNLQVSLSTGSGFVDYDRDINFLVGYKNLSEKNKWRDLSSEKRPILYVKGKIVEVSGSRDVGVLASDIVIIGDSNTHADLKKGMEQVVKGN
jgi:outer membrane lipoprotein-sorting protein